jgi:ribonuclease P protein component
VKRAGRRLRTEHLEVRAIDSLLSHVRVGVVVGKFGHTIIERNKLKRRLRELVRTRLIPLAEATDIVVRSLPVGYQATFDDLKNEIDRITDWLPSVRVSQ